MTDSNDQISRRQLFARTSKMAVAGAMAAESLVHANEPPATCPAAKQTTDKILNYHPKMKYRRLGKTGLMLSEVSLGGHWTNRKGGRYWLEFENNEVPADVAKNRTEVVSACIDAGMNYLDLTTSAECMAYGVALKGRRGKFLVGADDCLLCIRREDKRNVRSQTENIDKCLQWLQTDYLDIWRSQALQVGDHDDSDIEVVIEAGEKAKKAGKIRHLGLSSHNRIWLQHVIEKYPPIEMVIFPVTAKTKKKGLPITKENIVERKQHYKNCQDISTSIFESVRKKDVGLVSIKPFMGGFLFKGKMKFPVQGVGTKRNNDLGRLTLQCILARHEEITAAVPGLTTIHEVESAVRASYLRELAMMPAETQWLDEVTEEGLAALPDNYRWLRDWDVI